MQETVSHGAVRSSGSATLDDVERTVLHLGREVFRDVGRSQSRFWKRDFWAKRGIYLLSRYPALKAGAFQLVDTLPTLRTEDAIARHVRMFLHQSLIDIHPWIAKLVDAAPGSFHARILAKVTERVIQSIASQFIAGHSPESVLPALKDTRRAEQAFTVDLLGEFCLTESEAEAYRQRYVDCLKVFGRHVERWEESAPIINGSPGEESPIAISIKLSALYSQCSALNFKRSVDVLTRRLSSIAARVQEIGASLCIDPEDELHNPVIYDTFLTVFSDAFASFRYPTIGVQAYARHSHRLLEALLGFAEARGGPIGIRLVKGAYWDSETNNAALNGTRSPLYTYKASTDANYERCTRFLLNNSDHFYPQFASHNIRSLSYACAYAKSKGITTKHFELQVLYGMADAIGAAFTKRGYLVRKYIPIGETLPGLGYLVRRLLENTSNESFLKHAFFERTAIEGLLQKPHFHPSEDDHVSE